MLSHLDSIIFPDRCEVIEVIPTQRYVYPIYKNGQSSLMIATKQNNWNIFLNEKIKKINSIDVFVRDPIERLASGISSFIQATVRDHPDLDVDTAFWFAKRYKFLNTHYLPQFHWVANLSQYLNPTAKIRFRNFQNFGNITSFQDRALVIPPTQEFVTKLLTNDTALELWLYLDQLLLELAGQQLTWQEVIDHYKVNYPDVIAHVLPKT